MKLATLEDGSRDGRLVVLPTDLRHAVAATNIAPTLLRARDHWGKVESPLRSCYNTLNASTASGTFDFEQNQAMAPLPRCYQFLKGSTLANHGRPMEKAFGMDITTEYLNWPLVDQGASDEFIGPCDDVKVPGEAGNLDFEDARCAGPLDFRRNRLALPPIRPAGAAP